MPNKILLFMPAYDCLHRFCQAANMLKQVLIYNLYRTVAVVIQKINVLR